MLRFSLTDGLLVIVVVLLGILVLRTGDQPRATTTGATETTLSDIADDIRYLRGTECVRAEREAAADTPSGDDPTAATLYNRCWADEFTQLPPPPISVPVP